MQKRKLIQNLDLNFSLSLGQIVTILILLFWLSVYILGVLEYGFWGPNEMQPDTLIVSLEFITYITGRLLIGLSLILIFIYIVKNWNKNIINFKIKHNE